MRKKNTALVALLLVLMLLAVVAGLVWHMYHYTMVDFKFYPKDAAMLDLRGQEITVAHYSNIRRRLPDTQILWDVPIQGRSYSEDTTHLSVAALSSEDIKQLDYLPELEVVDANGCTDYAQLLALQQRRPEVDVQYTVTIGGREYAHNTVKAEISDITAEEIALLAYLPRLNSVHVSGGDAEPLFALQEACRERDISFYVNVGGRSYVDTVEKLTVSGITNEELPLMQLLTQLESLRLPAPDADASSLVALQTACPDVDIIWDHEVAGMTFTSDASEIDISSLWPEKVVVNTWAAATAETEPPVTVDLDDLAEEMAYFPNAETLFLGLCEMDNEELAEFREEMRDEFKVVWTVRCGDKLTVRTDATTFMPVREHVYYFKDHEAYNLRYCEDMVCIDIGHMSIHNVDWAAFMPKLKYLVLAHTQVDDLSGLDNCKELVFLELDWSCVRDYTPLLGCTALEDLNLGLTYGDIEPITQMTWLKHLWWKDRASKALPLQEALPDTVMNFTSDLTVGGGWRKLQNYYDMRDLLGMEYMSG